MWGSLAPITFCAFQVTNVPVDSLLGKPLLPQPALTPLATAPSLSPIPVAGPNNLVSAVEQHLCSSHRTLAGCRARLQSQVPTRRPVLLPPAQPQATASLIGMSWLMEGLSQEGIPSSLQSGFLQEHGWEPVGPGFES